VKRMLRNAWWERSHKKVIAFALLLSLMPTFMWAQSKPDKSFTAIVTDDQGVETEIRNVVFYWEEKLSETAFVPHELRHLPVKRGSTFNNIPFDKIRQVEIKLSGPEGVNVVVTLANGKTGEFTVTTFGSFRGDSDFGQVDVSVIAVSKVVIK